MKKRGWMMAVLFAAVLALGGCRSEEKALKKEIKEAVGVEVGEAEMMKYEDTHGGFHGDGTTFAAFRMTEEEALPQFEEAGWQRLPFDRTATALAYGITEGNVTTGPYMTDGEGKTMLPEIEKGYYYFLDRYPGEEEQSKNVLERSAVNFTMAVYDTETGTMYYVKIDT